MISVAKNAQGIKGTLSKIKILFFKMFLSANFKQSNNKSVLIKT
jgi:hypothetical protein